MASKLEWVFSLIDKVSGPGRKMETQLGAVEKATHSAAGGFHKLHDAVELAYEGGIMLAEGFEKLKEIGGEVIDHMRFKQDSLIALEALRGTREEAIGVFEGVEDFAYKTGQSVKDVMRVTKDLVASGFNDEEVDTFRLLLADLRIIDPAKAETVAAALGMIGRRGEMSTREMRMLSNAGVDLTLMYEKLAAMTGRSVEQLKAMGSIKIKGGTAKGLIADVLLGKYSGGVAGSLVEKEMKTLPVALDRLKQIPERILDTLAGFEGGAGGGALERIAFNIAEAFDPEGEHGRRIIADLQGLVDSVAETLGLRSPNGLFAELAGPNGAMKVEQVFHRVVQWLRDDAVPAALAFGHAVGTIADAVIRTASAIDWIKGGNPLALQLPEEREVARRTLADPNSSEASREYATRLLRQQNNVSVSVNVQGNATKEDAERIAQTSSEAVGAALEQHALEAGAY